MKKFFQLTGNELIIILITLILGAGQVSLWLQLFGYFPPPNCWIPTLVFLVIFRGFKEGFFMTILLGASVSTLTATPLMLFLVTNLIVFFMAHLTKHRIFWTGPTYFMMMSGIASVSFPVFHLMLSWIWEEVPITDVQIFSILIRGLLTALLALPLYYLFGFVDSKTKKEQPTDSGTLLYE